MMNSQLAASEKDQTALDDGTSSIYSTSSTFDESETEDDDGEEVSDDVQADRLRMAFQNVCHVGLRIARLRHRRKQAQEELAAAEEAVARLGSELLLERLDLDDAAKADEIVDVLLLGSEHPPPGVETPMTTPVPPLLGVPLGSRVLTLQQAVRRVGRQRQSLARLDGRLETEQRLVLWPALERWRRAVVAFHRQRRRPSRQADQEPARVRVLVDDREQLLQAVQRMLPRLDRQRLQQLWEHIGHALLSVPGTSGRPEPAQLFI